MEIQEILERLHSYTGGFPRQAVLDAIREREQITPELLRLLEQTTNNAEKVFDDGDYMAHLYGMFLLAQFRERRAYPLIVNFFSLRGEISLDLTGDLVTEYLDRLLASVWDGDLSLIKGLIENRSINEWVRGAGLAVLNTLVFSDLLTREEVVAYHQALFHGGSSESIPTYGMHWPVVPQTCTLKRC